ncbi:MAG: glutamate 5-kinase [Coriobacteriia bacterium]|nr:glutamate 5-kinase [Coriobacteriia bacterium]
MSGRRIVIKVGSSTLTDGDGSLDRRFIESLVKQLVQVREDGDLLVLVSSGAISAGISKLGIDGHPTDVPSLQAVASVGQVALVGMYAEQFAKHGLAVGQVLLTRHDTGHRQSFLHARDTIEGLLALGVVPVVNENDTIAVDEIRFGDNDTLAALVATMVKADLVVVLSDIEGMYDADPREVEGATVLEQVDEFTDEMIRAAGGAGSTVGSGGMVTKLEAARVLVKSGIPMVLCSGRREGVVADAVAGEDVGTYFSTAGSSRGALKSWIALGRSPSGRIVVDEGAKEAIVKRKKSLLPAGVIGVDGEFVAGDAVVLVDAFGMVVARGLAGLSSSEAEAVRGMKTQDIALSHPHLAGKTVVHRDRMAVL